MAYNLNKTDGNLLVTILDGTTTGQTNQDRFSLVFIGKNYPNYGAIEQSNFLKLLENGANSVNPLDNGIIPVRGELWYDTANKKLKIYDGVQFKAVGTATGSSEPLTPATGDTWWDTGNNQFKVYNGTAWVVVGPSYDQAGGITGTVIETIQDVGQVDRKVITEYTSGVRTAILSQHTAFQANTDIPGYELIKPGINFNFGTGNGFTLTQNSTTTELVNNKSNGDIKVVANLAGTLTTALTVSGTTGLITIGGMPTVPLGIASKSYVDQEIVTLSGIVSSSGSTFTANINALTSNAAAQATSINSINNLKANIASPALTGTPLAPTASEGTNTTQIATTAFVTTAVATANTALRAYSETYAFNTANAIDTKLKANVDVINANIGTLINNAAAQGASINSLTVTKAPSASPTLTGSPLSVTAPTGTANTMIATTAFVTTAIQTSTDALWKGSNKYISQTTPTAGDGANGDIWFQI